MSTGIELEIAKLMVEYGPKWGFEVTDAIKAMALQVPDNDATHTEHTRLAPDTFLGSTS